jgi:hypothetical protein
MQKYFTQWGHHLYPLDGEQHPNEQGYYRVEDADTRISELERALKATAIHKAQLKRIEELEEFNALCPRPSAGRPEIFSEAACIAAGECGCQPEGEAVRKMKERIAELEKALRERGHKPLCRADALGTPMPCTCGYSELMGA